MSDSNISLVLPRYSELEETLSSCESQIGRKRVQGDSRLFLYLNLYLTHKHLLVLDHPSYDE